MNLLKRNWRTVAIFLVVVGILVLALSGYFAPLSKVTLGPLVGIQQWISNRFVNIYEYFAAPRDMQNLEQRNTELEAEVARLQTDIIQLEQQLKEAETLYALLDFARSSPESQYVAAAVIGRDTSPYLRYIFINHGADDGLRHGMPVVNERGLVGRVDAVNATAARVQLISDPGFSADVRIQPLEADAVLGGSLTGEISLDMISQDVPVSVGNLVLTSGLGGLYPPDVMVGQIVSVRSEATGLFQTASVQPSVDFANLRAVLVIVNFRPVDFMPLIPTAAP